MNIKFLADGGNMKPGPTLSQKVGPTGISMNLVIQKINEATKDFDGMKVPVEVNLDSSTGKIEVTVFSPPTAELLKSELKIAKGSGIQKQVQVANASIEQIIAIAKTKSPNLLSTNLKAAVKTVVGSCGSLGILIENKFASEIEKDIDKGKYDKEISEEKTKPSQEKIDVLNDSFAKLKIEQDKILKQIEAAKQEGKDAAAAPNEAVPKEAAPAAKEAKKK
ncbi:MAG: 50S ribosomal protein L11 [archaeon]